MKNFKSQNPTGIQIFKNEVFGEIRTCQEKNQIMFVGKDVASALGYSNTRKALQDHVDEEDKRDGVTIRDSIGRIQKAVFINESGLYSLILSSKLPQAKAFKRWVTSVVLPQIRKTGSYIPELRLLNAPASNCMTATEIARLWGMDVKAFNNLLEREGIQYRENGSWHLTEELENLGLAEERHFMYYSLNGEQKSRIYLVWTPKGVEFLGDRCYINFIN